MSHGAGLLLLAVRPWNKNPQAQLLQHLLKAREKSHRTNALRVIGGRKAPKIRPHLLLFTLL
jgi:hypothetical protein